MNQEILLWDFRGGPGVKDLPSSTGCAGLITGWGIKVHISRAAKPTHHNKPIHPHGCNNRSPHATAQTHRDFPTVQWLRVCFPM